MKRRKRKFRKLINSIAVRIIGILLIWISVAIIYATDEHDCTHLVVTLPVSLIMIAFPEAYNLFDLWDKFKEEFKDDFL